MLRPGSRRMSPASTTVARWKWGSTCPKAKVSSTAARKPASSSTRPGEAFHATREHRERAHGEADGYGRGGLAHAAAEKDADRGGAESRGQHQEEPGKPGRAGCDEPDFGQSLGRGLAAACHVEQRFVQQAQGLQVYGAVACVQEHGVHGGAVAVGDEHGCGHREEGDLDAQHTGARMQPALRLSAVSPYRERAAAIAPRNSMRGSSGVMCSWSHPGFLAQSSEPSRNAIVAPASWAVSHEESSRPHLDARQGVAESQSVCFYCQYRRNSLWARETAAGAFLRRKRVTYVATQHRPHRRRPLHRLIGSSETETMVSTRMMSLVRCAVRDITTSNEPKTISRVASMAWSATSSRSREHPRTRPPRSCPRSRQSWGCASVTNTCRCGERQPAKPAELSRAGYDEPCLRARGPGGR